GALNDKDMVFKAHGFYDHLVIEEPGQVGKFVTVYPNEGMGPDVAARLTKSLESFYKERGLDPAGSAKNPKENDYGYFTGRGGRMMVDLMPFEGKDGNPILALHGTENAYDDGSHQLKEPMTAPGEQPLVVKTKNGELVVHPKT